MSAIYLNHIDIDFPRRMDIVRAPPAVNAADGALTNPEVYLMAASKSLSPAREEWKDIPGWEGKAQVSNLGRVRTKTRGIKDTWRTRKLNPNHRYQTLSLPKRPGDVAPICVAVHRTVARAWLGPRPPGMVVRHLNNLCHDNRACNLAYGTIADNKLDDVRNGTFKGEHNPSAKLRAKDIPKIRKLLKTEMTLAEIGKHFNISLTAIWRIKKGITWSHIS